MNTATLTDTVTLTDLADEANLSLPESYARLAGFTSGHLDATSPLSDADASMIRTLLAPEGFTDCGCVPSVGHTAPCLLAPPAICPECGTPTLDVDGVCDQSQLPDNLPGFDAVSAAGLDGTLMAGVEGHGPHGAYTWEDVAKARADRALAAEAAGDPYTSEPIRVRIFGEEGPDGMEWHIDGTDAEGRYTEACWNFDSQAEAVNEVPAFVEAHAFDGATGVTWQWDPKRDKAARFVTMTKGPLA